MASYDKEAVQKWISEYWTGTKDCLVCGSNDWILMDNVWELRDFHGGDFSVGGPVLPLIALMCNVCGHTLLFNAIAVRAIERSPAPEAQGE